jgi:molecular chaperone HscB
VRVEKTVQDLEELVGRRDWENVKAAAIRLKYLQGIEQTANEKLRDL